jgi:hypothetical protein
VAEDGEAEEGEVRGLLCVELDDLELHATNACLPLRYLILVDQADNVGLLPVEPCARLHLGDSHDLLDYGFLLLVVVDVVAGGEM